MSVYSSTNIIKDNLVYYLDAENIKSYNPAENLFTYSEDLSNAIYTKSAHTIISAGFPSSGPKAGYLVTNNQNTSNFGLLSLSYNTSTLTSYTYSAYIKANTQPNTSILIGTNGYDNANTGGCYFRTVFNTTNKTFNLPQLVKFASDPITIDNFTYGYSDVGNDWYRLYVTADLSNHANVTNISAGLYVGVYGNIIAANGTSIYTTGWMLDSTKSLNTYTKTTDAVITKPSTTTSLSPLGSIGTLNNRPIYNNGVLEFNGINQNITHPAIPEIRFLGTDPYTINIWINNTATAANVYPGILWHENNPGSGRDGYDLYTTKVGMATGYTYISSERWSSGTNTNVYEYMADADLIGKWNNICITYNGSTLSMYRNATFKSSTTSSGSITNTTTSLYIGSLNVGTYGNNKIGLVSIYNKALSQSDITQNYNAIKSRYGL